MIHSHQTILESGYKRTPAVRLKSSRQLQISPMAHQELLLDTVLAVTI